jgi:hypothetical protein
VQELEKHRITGFYKYWYEATKRAVHADIVDVDLHVPESINSALKTIMNIKQ